MTRVASILFVKDRSARASHIRSHRNRQAQYTNQCASDARNALLT